MSLAIDPDSMMVALAAALQSAVPSQLAAYASARNVTLPPIAEYEARDDIEDPAPKNRPHLAVRQEPGRDDVVDGTCVAVDYHRFPVEVVVTVDASNGDRSDAGVLAGGYRRAVEYCLTKAARTIPGVITVTDIRTRVLPQRSVANGKRNLRQAIVRGIVHMRTTRGT